MAAVQNGHVNGMNVYREKSSNTRFTDIPAVIDIPVRGEDGDEAVNLDLTELLDETDELCDLLENENAARNYWITIALAYAKQGKVDISIDILTKGLRALARGRPDDQLSILVCLCWLNLWKCRHAPRVRPSQPSEDTRTKDHFLQAATSNLNEASRISPSHPPLFLAKGTLYLLRASLQPAKAASSSSSREQSERADTLRQAQKCFDDAWRSSNYRNILALMGKAKAQFSLGKPAEALSLYQLALEKAPDMIDPDPRIGIGCCLWQLGYKDNAKQAWQRALELNEGSVIANVLLGLRYLEEANQYTQRDDAWKPLYAKAMTGHIQSAFKQDGMHALTCAAFGTYFLMRRTWPNVERLARRAIEHTDVNAIASDGWFLLARKDHFEGDYVKAAEHYNKADQARGGDEKGYLPAQFGAAQLRAQAKDFSDAKFRLEKIVEKNRNVEAMTLLGILHAEEVFQAQASNSKDDKSMELKRAIGMLEQVRVVCKDSKKKIQPDPAVLLNLARLYESIAPEKALLCLQQVESMALEEISDEDLPQEAEDEADERRLKRELLNPQLLNNIGCFHFQAEKYSEARDDFQSALNSCVKMGDRDPSLDIDAMVSTISFNLARTYEAEHLDDQAKEVYTGLLQRHPEYIDAKIRMAYLELRADPREGADAIKSLIESDPGNLEVRSLYGWYVNRTKKRTLALNEDQEQRHYKQTLQTYDKHDLYSLVGMGNLHLIVAREMPRETDQHKERRSKTYVRAVEFFDKVLALDPCNSFAAQGMAIAMVEEKKDTAAAIQVFSKVRESIKDASVHINLGHVFADVRQYSRAVENYELALAKSKGMDPQILACLGRVWLLRGRQEKRLDAYKTSLDISKQALAASPNNINFRFNVAFVQIQLAQIIITLPEAQKTLVDVEAASTGLDEAIEAFDAIAKSPNPPFPKHDIEQRANMGRNTMKRQLMAAIERQTEYEQKNASRLEEARKQREADIRKREEEKRIAFEKAEQKRQQIAEERERMMEEDRLLIERRLEEEKAREAAEWTTDEETGERKKREKKPREKRQKRKKKRDDSDIEPDEDDGEGGDGKARSRTSGTPPSGSEAEAPRRKKKRKLESRKGRATSSKYKSADIVEDSSEDDDAAATRRPQFTADDSLPGTPGADPDSDVDNAAAITANNNDDDEAEEDATATRPARRKPARILTDEDDDEDDNGEVVAAGSSAHGGDGIE